MKLSFWKLEALGSHVCKRHRSVLSDSKESGMVCVGARAQRSDVSRRAQAAHPSWTFMDGSMF